MKRFHFLFCLLLGATLACEPGPRAVEPGASPASSAMTVTADDTRLVIAAEDHDQVLVVDRASKDVLQRIAVGDAPSHVIMTGATTAVVTTRYGHTVEVIDIESGTVLQTASVGVEPLGLTQMPDGSIAVVLAGERAVVRLHAQTLSVLERIELGLADPRAIAHVNGKLVVTHLTAGQVSEIDVESGNVRAVSLAIEVSGPRLHPNLIRSMTVAPDDQMLVMAHSQANADTMRAPIGQFGEEFNDEFEGEGGSCGYGGCGQQLGANTPAITIFDADSGAIVPQLRAGGNEPEPQPEFEEDCFDCGTRGPQAFETPATVLAPFEGRFAEMVPMNNPVAIALLDGGRGQIVLNQGTQNAVLLRRDLNGLADDVIGVANVGHGASTVVVNQSGTHAYVWNQFDASVTEIEIPVFEDRARALPGVFTSTRRSREFEEVREVGSETFALVEDALTPEVSAGRKLFHSATDDRISTDHSVSCATCHPDGRSDNRTWQFTFGPRNTPQLGGGILDTAPFHWPGDVEDIPDLNRMTVLAFMGGSGVDDDSMNAIGAFIDTIRPAPAPNTLANGLTEAQERGRVLFNDAEVGCASCHNGPHFTDNISYDVQTKAGVFDIQLFQTPVLHGLARSAPYLHDGSARSLLELVLEVVATDKMGKGSHLDDTQLLDLADYLETL